MQTALARSLTLAAAFAAAATISACDKTIILPPGSPTSGTVTTTTGGANVPTPLPTTRPDVIEYRVTGTASSTRVRYSSSADGLTQVITTLPYTQTFTSNEASIFLSLEATAVTNTWQQFPFLSVQILVNGTLFRGASADTLTGGAVAVSGTWRRAGA